MEVSFCESVISKQQAYSDCLFVKYPWVVCSLGLPRSSLAWHWGQLWDPHQSRALTRNIWASSHWSDLIRRLSCSETRILLWLLPLSEFFLATSPLPHWQSPHSLTQKRQKTRTSKGEKKVNKQNKEFWTLVFIVPKLKWGLNATPQHFILVLSCDSINSSHSLCIFRNLLSSQNPREVPSVGRWDVALKLSLQNLPFEREFIQARTNYLCGREIQCMCIHLHEAGTCPFLLFIS